MLCATAFELAAHYYLILGPQLPHRGALLLQIIFAQGGALVPSCASAMLMRRDTRQCGHPVRRCVPCAWLHRCCVRLC